MMPSDIVVAFFIAEGFFSDPSEGSDWPVYNDRWPDDSTIVDDIAGVFNTAGVLHGKDMLGIQYQHHGIQIRIRSFDPQDAYVKAQEVVASILPVHEEEVEVGEATYEIQSFTQTTDIVPISIDEKKRTNYTVNVIVSLQTA